jgi:hypothetical protein
MRDGQGLESPTGDVVKATGAKESSKTGAILSDDRKYRYVLWRDVVPTDGQLHVRDEWSRNHGDVVFVGLNPSTADEDADDPTIRRCVGFARSWGFKRLVMLNLFAYRATDPQRLRETPDPVGPDNDQWLRAYTKARLVVFAWGTRGDLFDRADAVRAWFPNGHTLGLTKHGHPRHPLYVKADRHPFLMVSTERSAGQRGATLSTDGSSTVPVRAPKEPA